MVTQNAATRSFVKIMVSTADEAVATINAKYDMGDVRGLEALSNMYARWTRTSGNGNVWAWIAEYAAAAAEVAATVETPAEAAAAREALRRSGTVALWI